MQNPTTTTPDLDEILPAGWLGRLAAFLTVAGAGSEGEGDDGGEGDGGDADDSGLEGADEDDDTVFGGDDDDDGDEDEGEPGVQRDDDQDEDEEDDDDSLFDDPDEDEEGAEGDDDTEEGDGDDEGDEEEEPDEEAEQRHREDVERLEELWEARLERAKAQGEGEELRLDVKLGDVQPTPELYSKFKRILSEEGEDHEVQARAIFEVAMDAVIGSLNAYHQQGVLPHLQKQQQGTQKARLQSAWDDFKTTPEGKTALEDTELMSKMQELWKKKVEAVGVELAMRIPYKDYFRLAGGRVKKGAKKAAAKAAKKKASSRKADKQKRSALAGQKAPRAKRGAGRVAQRPKAKGVEAESAEYLAATSEPFFNVT